MKEIVIFGSCETLVQGLKHAISDEFRLIALQNNAKEYLKQKRPAAAVVCMHGMSDLDVTEGVTAPFIVLSDSAEETWIDGAVARGAKYFFVEPVSASLLATRLEWLAREASPAHTERAL